MPKLSLYRPNRTRDYQYLDRVISERYTVGGLDVYLHKYLGPQTGGEDSALSGNADATQPVYDTQSPLNIQDLLLLENRDRVYDQDIYVMRGVYNTQDIDFDLTQFGLFLNSDTLFITFHFNDMIDTLGRKIMSGDVLELPNLLDYYPLNQTIPKPIPRFYVVQDADFASEGFSQTWLPHIWRVKSTPLTNAQEFKDILKKPVVNSTIWDPDNFYPQGSIVNQGDVYYQALQNVPADVDIGDTNYWQEYTPPTQSDLNSTRAKDQQINDAILTQANVEVPASGYDTTKFYILPTTEPKPATPPVFNLWDRDSTYVGGTVVNIGRDYWTAKTQVPAGVDISNTQFWEPYVSGGGGQPAYPVGLGANSNTTIDGTQGGMNTSPRGPGYTLGYLTGDGVPPNGLPVTTGVRFPDRAVDGDFCLRLDYFPNRLFRYDGRRWIKIEDSVRTNLDNGPSNNTQRSSFVNNEYTVPTTDQGNIPSRQSLSQALRPQADNGNQGGSKPARPRPNTQPGQPNFKNPPLDE
jgi:hypothetical protein